MWSYEHDPDELKAQLEQALDETQRIDILLALANIHVRDELFDRYFEEAKRLLSGQAHPDVRQKANLCFLRGSWLSLHQSDDESPIDVLNDALALYVEIGDARGELECLQLLALTNGWSTKQGDLVTARNALERCQVLLEENDFPPLVEAEMHYSTSKLFVDMDMLDLAEDYALKVQEQINRLSHQVEHLHEGRLRQKVFMLQGGTLSILSMVRIKQERYAEAFDYAQQDLQLCQDAGVEIWVYSALFNLCIALVALGRPKEAILHLEPTFTDLAIGEEITAAQDYCSTPLGQAYMATGQNEKARQMFERTVALADMSDIPRDIFIMALDGLGTVLKRLGKYEQACRYMEMYAKERSQLLDSQHNKRLRMLSAQYEYDLKRHEAEILQESNKQLTEANRLLKQAYSEQSELLKIVAHDLRNPLQVIALRGSMAGKFIRRDVPEKALKNVKAVCDSAAFMDEIIYQLQTMSDVDEERMEIDWQTVSLCDVLKVVVSRNRIMARQKGITIAVDALESLDVSADPTILQRIFENLLSNSIKYSPLGTIVTVRVRSENDTATVALIDQGVGLAEAELSKLFTKFGRLPSSRPTADEQSTGLGLYITKKQVEAMGGGITAVSDGLNEGSTFTITLPLYVQNEMVVKCAKSNSQYVKDSVVASVLC